VTSRGVPSWVVGAATVIALVACGAAGAPRGRPADGHAEESTASRAPGRLLEGVPYAAGASLDVHRPPAGRGTVGSAPPTVVLAHGCCGDRADLGKLAEALAEAGAVVLNVDWPGLDADARFPEAYEDVACAVRFAHAEAAGLGGDPGRVVLVGWSDGALVASVVAARGDTFDARRCRQPDASARPDAVVGIAGFYGWPVPVPPGYVTPRAEAFLGGSPATAAQAWGRATPYSWLGTGTAPPAVLLVGTTDPLVADARRYASALQRAGGEVRLVELPPAGDQTLLSPRTREGRRVVAEVLGAGGRAPLPVCELFPGLVPCDAL
jgi:acetyl esterase/lipase